MRANYRGTIMKLRRLLLSSLFAFSAFAAQAANLPLITTPLDPSQSNANFNGLIQSLNAGTDGLLNSTFTAVNTSGTTISTLASYTLAGGALATAGQVIHVKAWGVNSADANAKTLTLGFGAASVALVVTGSGLTWTADFYVMKNGASTQILQGSGLTGTTAVALVTSTGSVTDTSAITILIQGTAATAGTMTLTGSYIEQIK
jgi:hypothetical protein